MYALALLISVACCSYYVDAIEQDFNCSKVTGTHACYTCMGRDMENCEEGTVCCTGSCFKLVDTTHDLIMKGCTKENQEDGSMKRKTLDVKLYWVNDEKVTGEAYYCKGSEYCNGATTIAGLLTLIGTVLCAQL